MQNMAKATIRLVRDGTLAAPTPKAKHEPRDSKDRTRPTARVSVSTSWKNVPMIQYTNM
jgi:hypothetical protein